MNSINRLLFVSCVLLQSVNAWAAQPAELSQPAPPAQPVPSVQSVPASQATCSHETEVISLLEQQIDVAESQIGLLRTNRVANAVNAGPAIAILGVSALVHGRSALSLKDAGIPALAALGAAGFNFHSSGDQIDRLQELVVQSKEQLSEKRKQIETGHCLPAVTAGDESAQVALQKMMEAQATFASATQNLVSKLGNPGIKAATMISVSADIALVAGVVALYTANKSKAVGAGKELAQGAQKLLSGGMKAAATGQVWSSITLLVSAREANALLEILSQAQAQMTEHEQALQKLVAAERLLAD